MKILLTVAAFLGLATSASAGQFFIYDNWGNSIIGRQNAYGGMASDNWGNAVYWSGSVTPVIPLYRTPSPYFYTYPVYAPGYYPVVRYRPYVGF